MLTIKDPILVMCRSATMPKKGALLLCCACPDEPAIDKRLMMKRAIALALLTLSQWHDMP
jgi:hypothetical protein